jgi:hypothetical protein
LREDSFRRQASLGGKADADWLALSARLEAAPFQNAAGIRASTNLLGALVQVDFVG